MLVLWTAETQLCNATHCCVSHQAVDAPTPSGSKFMQNLLPSVRSTPPPKVQLDSEAFDHISGPSSVEEEEVSSRCKWVGGGGWSNLDFLTVHTSSPEQAAPG